MEKQLGKQLKLSNNEILLLGLVVAIIIVIIGYFSGFFKGW